MQGFTEEHLSNAQFGRNKARFSIGARGNRDKSVTSHVKVKICKFKRHDHSRL